MDFTRYEPAWGSQDSVRFAYLRLPVLRRAFEDDKILEMLLKELGITRNVKTVVLKAMARPEKVKLVSDHIDFLRSQSHSEWHRVEPPEVLAALIFDAVESHRYVSALFSNAKNEAALKAPVSAWLRAKDLHVFDEVQMGSRRADVIGYKKGGFFTSTEVISVELKDDLKQLEKAWEQIQEYGDYSHKVYLGCTPFLAANYVSKHADGVKVKSWDARVLDRKLEQLGAGLLLVEGDTVYEYKAPKLRDPASNKLDEVALALKGR